MNIFENFDPERYALLLGCAKEMDAHVVHTFDKANPRGGFTFVWRRSTNFAKSKMIEVAVSFCSPKDQFCRKIGAYNALSNFNDGSSILLPVGSVDSEDIVLRLRQIFYHAQISNIPCN